MHTFSKLIHTNEITLLQFKQVSLHKTDEASWGV